MREESQMSAHEAVAVAPEFGGEASLNTAAELLFDATVDTEVSSPLSELDDDVPNGVRNGVADGQDDAERVVKLEKDSDALDLNGHTTATTLRPDPVPSKKRRESEVECVTPDLFERPNDKKRKRGESPPWHFPTAETTTLKTADGRRASARVNTGTPSAPESNVQDDTRARSSSLSAPSQLRSRLESPPWKKFAADGPTSMVVDGKRKSGRVNKELSDPPKRVSPRSKKVDGKVSNNHAKTAKPISSSKALHTAVNGAGHPSFMQNGNIAWAPSRTHSYSSFEGGGMHQFGDHLLGASGHGASTYGMEHAANTSTTGAHGAATQQMLLPSGLDWHHPAWYGSEQSGDGSGTEGTTDPFDSEPTFGRVNTT